MKLLSPRVERSLIDQGIHDVILVVLEVIIAQDFSVWNARAIIGLAAGGLCGVGVIASIVVGSNAFVLL